MTNTIFQPRPSPSLQKILSVDNEELEDPVKQRIRQWLLYDASCLLYKKHKEEEKRERVKKMEEDYEQKRMLRHRAQTERETKSELMREKQREEQNKKFKSKEEDFLKVTNKINRNNRKEQREAFKLQKELLQQRAMELRSPRDSVVSLGKSHPSRKQSLYLSQSSMIDEKMAAIAQKTDKAQRLQEFQNQMTINKMKERNRIVEETLQQLNERQIQKQAEKIKSICEKIVSIQKVNEKWKYKSERKLSQKQKIKKQKLQKCNENLKHLFSLQKQRNKRLQNKFNRQSEPKQWKDDRLQKNMLKCMQNSKRIEQQKQQKAQQILLKHQQISQQNKIYKSHYDQLLQALKFTN